jgi:hypothetical protein
MRRFGSFIAIAMTCAFSVGLYACTLDAAKIEKSITDELEAKKVKVKSIKCPKDRKQQKGDKFTCEGETKDGTTFTVNVSQEDAGNIKWELVGRIMDPADLEKDLNGKVGDGFKCGSEVVIVKKGSTLECKGAERKVKLTFKDDEGNADPTIE